uniref:ATP-dependent Clp protease proteolytic subunit n=1 Tax=Diphelypaea coccinea TaxID=223087 RepID=A0A514TNG9_9LAMI|nr:ATP-dependent Clp protease proteolytic subunit [Diphelypaea coccinea]QDJ93977.1 ATP-dependent Clp protease proteolytic subunit [Diphelypaea coccinea]
MSIIFPDERPKVPQNNQWIWIEKLIFRKGSILIHEEIDQEVSDKICNLMLAFAIERPNQTQVIYINSPGGYIKYALPIYDLMQYLPTTFMTIGFGNIIGTAALLLLGGGINKRLILPHTKVSLYKPLEHPKILDLLSDSRIKDKVYMEMLNNFRQVGDIIEKRTGLDRDTVFGFMNDTGYMSAAAAKYYKIVDEIVTEKLIDEKLIDENKD